MVVLKTAAELTAMRDAGRISAQALLVGGEAVKPGVTTAEIDRKIHKFILSQGAKPSFLATADSLEAPVFRSMTK